MTLILSENALSILKSRYCQEGEETWEAVCKRVSKAIAYNESENKRQYWEEKFYNMLINMYAIPGGRILRNAGTKSNRLLNCHVLPLDDSIDSIGRFMHMALVLNAEGGGVGFRPKLRPKNAPIKTKGGKSSGVLSFLKAISYILDTVETGGNRRSGGLPILDVSHPEIVDFINAKLAENELNNFNISVGITNEFLDAVEKKDKWKLKFGNDEYGEKQAVDLFDMIIENMIKSGEPGLINLDNMSISNSFYYAPIEATNLCSELPLPAFVSCCLGSIVLPKFLSETGRTKWDDLADTIKTMVRFLDNVIDVTSYTFPEMQEASLAGRRIGLGMMGLGDYLLAKKVRYGSPSGLDKTDNVVRFIRDEAYRASIELAKEKGPFLKYLEWPYSKAKFIKTLPASLRMDIKKGGIRNISCLAYPPSGTTSLLADTTSGVEPLPFKAYIRHDRVGDRIYIHPLYKKFILENQPIPNWFVDAIDLSPEEHFETTVTIQKRNDGSISKTQILPAGTSPKQLKEWLLEYSRDLVGITAYVDGSRSGQVLRRLEESEVRGIIKKESKTENTLSEDDVNCKSGMCSI